MVAQLKRGDPSAFDAIYEHYRPRLFGFLGRLTQQRELAEDLLQETWLRLATHAPRLLDDTRLDAWLFTVARNLHRSHVRWQIVDIDHRRFVRRTAGEGIENTSPFDLTAASELERRLEHALALLPVKYREAVLLVAIERMKPADAARVLGLSAEALRQRLSRGRAMIAEHLDRKEQTDAGRATLRREGRNDAA